jgi:hypothetical protein
MSTRSNPSPEESILKDIQKLQSLEQELFTSLENDTTLSVSAQEKILDKINKITDMRLDLYQTLNDINKFYKNSLDNSNITLKEQKQAVTILENNLNQTKKKQQQLKERKNNKIRLVEINNYYGSRYEEHAELVKIIIFTLVPLVILSIGRRFVPDVLFYALVTIIVIIGSYQFVVRFWSTTMRDDMNYGQYNWYFNPATAPIGPVNIDDDKPVDPWLATGNWGTCIGSACCSEGQDYDDDKNLCVIAQPK